jgi:CRP/FNR family transcriptional regulator
LHSAKGLPDIASVISGSKSFYVILCIFPYNIDMDELQSLTESLRSVHFFARFADVDLRAIVTGGQIRHFLAGETIFFEGEACAGMHVLIRGQVHLCKIGPQGQTNIMAIVTPVIMINEVAVLDGGPNPMTAIAVRDCLLWQISHVTFQGLLKRYPEMGLGLLRVLAIRNREMLAQYEDVSFRSVLARAAKLLLDLSKYGQQPINRHEHSIIEMSSRIGSVPEAISRSLNTFKVQGLIKSNRTEILVSKPGELARLAQIEPQLLK